MLLLVFLRSSPAFSFNGFFAHSCIDTLCPSMLFPFYRLFSFEKSLFVFPKFRDKSSPQFQRNSHCRSEEILRIARFRLYRNYFNRNSIFEITRLNVATSDDPPRCDNTRTDKRGKERLVAFEEFAFLFALLFVKSHSIAIQLTKSSACVTLSDCW